LLNDQFEWEKLLRAYLIEEKVEFNDDEEPSRWWPLGTHRQVVVDPDRAFGAPIVAEQGVPTYLLAKGVGLESDVSAVARWYRVGEDAVRDAVDFENGVRAATS
jgi:uncharacterized protein (DUF433 family)